MRTDDLAQLLRAGIDLRKVIGLIKRMTSNNYVYGFFNDTFYNFNYNDETSNDDVFDVSMICKRITGVIGRAPSHVHEEDLTDEPIATLATKHWKTIIFLLIPPLILLITPIILLISPILLLILPLILPIPPLILLLFFVLLYSYSSPSLYLLLFLFLFSFFLLLPPSIHPFAVSALRLFLLLLLLLVLLLLEI